MRRHAIVFGIVCAIAGAATPAHAATTAPRLVRVIETYKWSPPSPDPMGLAYNSATRSLLVTDSEVDEMGIFAGVNFWEAALDGSVKKTHDLTPFTIEPADVAYNTDDGHYFFVDDDSDKVFEVDPSNMGAPIRSFSTRTFTGDPEGLSYGAGSLFVSGGNGDPDSARRQSIFRIQPGQDGIFNGEAPAGDDVVTRFSTVPLGQDDPEDVAYDPVSGNLFIVSRDSKVVAETTLAGELVASYDLSGSAIRKPAGVAVAPTSDDPGKRSVYVADRNVDNNTNPDENDGAIYEYEIGAAQANRPPVVTNPGNQRNREGDSVTLQIEASDPDGDTITYAATGLPPGLSIDRPSGVISGTIESGAAAGTPYDTRVTVSDGSASNEARFTWEVTDTSKPNPPSGLDLTSLTNGVLATWEPSDAVDLAGYNVYRSAQEAGPFTMLNGSLLTDTTYRDSGAPTNATSWYRVTAVDRSGNESDPAVGSIHRGPIQIVGVSVAKSKGMSLVIATPRGTMEGDVLLASITGRGYTSVAAPAGWTLLRDTVAGSAFTLKQTTFVRVATAAEPATHVFVLNGRGAAIAVMVAYRGASAPGAFSVGQANPPSSDIGAPATIAVASNSVQVGFFGIAAETTIAPAPGLTERVETTMGSGLLRMTLSAADDIVGAGQLGARSAVASAAGSSIGQVVVLQPAAQPVAATASASAARTASSASRVVRATSSGVSARHSGSAADDTVPDPRVLPA